MLQRGGDFLRTGNSADKTHLFRAGLVINDKGRHRMQVQSVGEGTPYGGMLAEPHEVRSLAKLSLDPIDRGAGRKARHSVVGEEHYQYR